MFDIEKWATSYEKTISLVSAVSTTAAVVVALWAAWLAKAAHKPKLRARLVKMAVATRESGPVGEYISVVVNNVGLVPINLNQFCFRLRASLYKKTSVISVPVHAVGDKVIHTVVFPVTVNPNTSFTLFILEEKQFEYVARRFLNHNWCNRLILAELTGAYLWTDGEFMFPVKISKDIRKQFRRLARNKTELSKE
ncbi:hypothetical protein [Teichococcus aestuarii]|uniref:hypothetical protein n=1 Tax=Teichococcus aestuarii TaxID=568898 RepID=UPI003621DCFA